MCLWSNINHQTRKNKSKKILISFMKELLMFTLFWCFSGPDWLTDWFLAWLWRLSRQPPHAEPDRPKCGYARVIKSNSSGSERRKEGEDEEKSRTRLICLVFFEWQMPMMMKTAMKEKSLSSCCNKRQQQEERDHDEEKKDKEEPVVFEEEKKE